MTNSIIIFCQRGDSTPDTYQGPDGQVYTNTCGWYNESEEGETEVNVWFNDPDGDCYSEDWIAEFHRPDGTTELKDAWSWGDPNVSELLNFNYFDCCDEIVVGAESCDIYTIDNTVYVDCGAFN